MKGRSVAYVRVCVRACVRACVCVHLYVLYLFSSWYCNYMLYIIILLSKIVDNFFLFM